MLIRKAALLLVICLGVWSLHGQDQSLNGSMGYSSIDAIQEGATVNFFLSGDISITGKVTAVTPTSIAITKAQIYKCYVASREMMSYIQISGFGPDIIIPYDNVLYYSVTKP